MDRDDEKILYLLMLLALGLGVFICCALVWLMYLGLCG